MITFGRASGGARRVTTFGRESGTAGRAIAPERAIAPRELPLIAGVATITTAMAHARAKVPAGRFMKQALQDDVHVRPGEAC